MEKIQTLDQIAREYFNGILFSNLNSREQKMCINIQKNQIEIQRLKWDQSGKYTTDEGQ